MKLYLSVIGIAMAVIAALNLALETAPALYILLATPLCTLLAFLLDGAVALLIRLTPDRLYGLDHPYFEVSEREVRFLKKMRVRYWKDKVWELGGIGGFSKKRLLSPNDPAYVDKFLVECHKGVVTHRLSYLVGLLVLPVLRGTPVLSVGLPIALVNLVLNIMPTMVLRYNTPMLKAQRRRLRKRAERSRERAVR